MRLVRILERLNSHPTTANQWLLKGGTALNLLHLDVPRMSVDIDLNFIGAPDREAVAAMRPAFEGALAAVCQREGSEIARAPAEHAGGKFRLRYASVLGGLQNLEIDVNYVARVPVLGTETRPTRFPPEHPVPVATLSLKELAAGKFTALLHRTVPRDAFDAAGLLDQAPHLLEDSEFRLAFVCFMAGARRDPRGMKPRDSVPTRLALEQQLVPVLQDHGGETIDSSALHARLAASLDGVSARLLNWTTAEREFLDLLHDQGRIDAALLHPDPEMQSRIALQPMLQWKAQNVRQHRSKGS
ncbi:MAG: nucleotidyl transferase AbiEii/AbiGii toxin family protein [Phycisphaeraceae bacterium]|nr:nucleotidyl transferase AbiEii/AbiGii toxin family protein [Phycisphaeraceae bacterium]